MEANSFTRGLNQVMQVKFISLHRGKVMMWVFLHNNENYIVACLLETE